MFANIIKYGLACKSCKNIRPNGLAVVESEYDFGKFSREELINEMNSFKHISCENCKTVGFWLVFKIYAGEDDVFKQLKLHIFKNNGKITGGILQDDFSPSQISVAFKNIRDKIEENFSSFFPSYSVNGEGFILIDFLENEPYSRISIFDMQNITISELIVLMDYLQEYKTQKDISYELAKNLELAMDDILLGRKLKAIAHLKNEIKKINIYLVAKDPNQDLFFGVIEDENDNSKKLQPIPLKTIREIDMSRIPMKKFDVSTYLKSGVKE